MKKKKSTKAKIRNLVRISLILFLSLILSIFFCRNQISANDKILESTAHDAFVYKSILIAHELEPNKPNSYSDIENLEDDSESFVSDVAIKTGSSQYYIRVNYGANCVNIYTKDQNGNYTKPYKAMICSTGKSTPTSGTYKISYKYRWLKLYGDVYGQYSTRIVKSILFHSVPYYEQSANTLEWDEFDKLGTTASAGCIRLTVQDAKWIYDNITSGTYVEFYSDKNNPGPLGKPKVQKISDNKQCRDWDPTDPDKNNPWNGGSGIPSIIYTKPPVNNTETQNNNSNTQEEKNTTTDTDNSTTENNSEKKDSENDIIENENNSEEENSTYESIESTPTSDNNIDETTISQNQLTNNDNTQNNNNSINDNNTIIEENKTQNTSTSTEDEKNAETTPNPSNDSTSTVSDLQPTTPTTTPSESTTDIEESNIENNENNDNI